MTKKWSKSQYEYVIPLLSQNMMTETRFAGNHRPTQIAHESALAGASDATRATFFTSPSCQWLAGLIDGDGKIPGEITVDPGCVGCLVFCLA